MNTTSDITYTLPNGLKVILRTDTRFPLVSARLYVHAGSSYETPEEAGISHVLEHMVFKGTTSYPKGAIATEIEGTGGYLNAATSFDYTVYLTDMDSKNWKKGLPVLKEMAFSPTLDATELEAEKDVVLAELKRGKDSPSSNMFDILLKHIFAQTPYERPIIGYEETIKAFTQKNITDYIEKWYQPQSMILLICGNFDVDEAKKEISAQFSGLTNTHTTVPPLRPLPVAKAEPVVEVQTGPWKKVHLTLAFPAPILSDIRAPQLDVLCSVMGRGSTSYLFKTYKYEKRLVDTISMSNYNFEKSGLLLIYATLDADKLVPFWTEITKDLAHFEKITFTQEEIDRAKLGLSDGLFRSKETIAGLSSKLGYFYMFGGGEDGENNYLRSINTTDQSTLTGLSREFFNSNSAVIAVLLPNDMKLEGYSLPSSAQSVSSWLKDTLVQNWKSPLQRPETTQQDTVGATEVIELGNSRTLILIEDTTLPYISADLVFTGGESLLSYDEQGLSVFTASLLTRGTKNHSYQELAEYFSDRAASLSASSERQTFTFSFEAPTQYTNDIFSILQDILTTPAMDSTEADRVKENILAQIVHTEESGVSYAFRHLFAFLFPNHTYGKIQLGTVEDVNAFTVEEVKTFWDKQKAQPWTLAICGTFDRESIIDIAKKLPAPTSAAPTVATPSWTKEKELTLTLPEREQAHYMLVFPTVPLADSDIAGLKLLNETLAGQSGLLFRDLRDKQGLGYTVTSLVWNAQHAGALIFYIGTDIEKLDLAHNGFLEIIKQLHTTPLPQEELSRGQNQLAISYHQARQKMSARSIEVGRLHAMGYPLDMAKSEIEKASKITPQELQEIAKKYLIPEKAYIVKVLPKEKGHN